ncbi:MAG: hypothetical protein U1E02_02500, partial [Hydrogenophaga sp.]|nr:hypothetical protein [Hydrogenophaga sp.]
MLTTQDLHALLSGQHPDPYAVLGLHSFAGTLWAHAFLPGAVQVDLLDRHSDQHHGTLMREPGT